jgi:uncharacterized protein (DUF58 family)
VPHPGQRGWTHLPVPSTRALWLLALGLAWPILLGGGDAVVALVGWDAGLLALVLLDGWRAPAAASFSAERRLREPLTAFASNPISLRLRSTAGRPLRIALADAPPPSFDAVGHRTTRLAPGAAVGGEVAVIDYAVTPRSRGRHAFGDLWLRVLGPLGLAWRPVRLPLGRVVSVYPDLGGAPPGLAGEPTAAPGPGRASRGARLGRGEGREFSALRHYLPGDDLRSIDWKATARRGWPVVREWQPERNQIIWMLVDCGRGLAARDGDGRTRLDRAVEAALALARAAAERGDQIGLILFGAGVERVVPAVAGRTRLGPLAEALHLAEARPVEADHGAAFDELLVRQRRRALVVVFTELSDPATITLLLARAELLRRRHLVAVAAIADPELVAATSARPATEAAAFSRAAAERIAGEREGAERRLAAAGVSVINASGPALAAAVVARYAGMKERGLL